MYCKYPLDQQHSFRFSGKLFVLASAKGFWLLLFNRIPIIWAQTVRMSLRSRPVGAEGVIPKSRYVGAVGARQVAKPDTQSG
jgi:hypothetical protein